MLYRKGMFAVIWAASSLFTSSWLQAQAPMTQYGRKTPADKGPRALGLVQLSPTGKKARFIPIAIMIDGKFYDAGSYKAAPVPMALDFGIVYEGFRTGVSQGVFTITQPGQLNHVWIAEGTWLPAGAIDPTKRKKYSMPVIADEDKEGPPVLHRRAEKADSDSSNKKEEQKPATPSAAPSPPPPGASAPTPPSPLETAKPPAPPEPAKASAPAAEEPPSDPNRPRLRRGKPDSTAHREAYTTFDTLPDAKPAAGAAKTEAKSAKDSAAAAPQIVLIPAISDVGGPDPRPYTYDVKPAGRSRYRSKMLDLADDAARRSSRRGGEEGAPTNKKASTSKSSGKSATKSPKLDFDDVRLRIFDLSNSNEPVLVLSAKTHPTGRLKTRRKRRKNQRRSR